MFVCNILVDYVRMNPVVEQRTRPTRSAREKPECCICMNAIESKDKKMLKCKHAFHKNCILQAFEFRNGARALCPMCRQPYILKPGNGSTDRHVEIETVREQEAVQNILSDDERYNRTIDDLCISFDTLFQDVQVSLPIRGNRESEWMTVRAEIIRLLTREYR